MMPWDTHSSGMKWDQCQSSSGSQIAKTLGSILISCESVRWASWHLKSQATQLFIQQLVHAYNKYIKVFIQQLVIPPLQRSWKGDILVSPCPSVHPSVCPSVDSIVSALHLQQYYSNPFHISISYLILKFWQICNFDFVFFWLGIQYDSIVWVFMTLYGGGGGILRTKGL